MSQKSHEQDPGKKIIPDQFIFDRSSYDCPSDPGKYDSSLFSFIDTSQIEQVSTFHNDFIIYDTRRGEDEGGLPCFVQAAESTIANSFSLAPQNLAHASKEYSFNLLVSTANNCVNVASDNEKIRLQRFKPLLKQKMSTLPFHQLAIQQFGTISTKYGKITNSMKQFAVFGRYVDALKKISEIPGQEQIVGPLAQILQVHEYGTPAFFPLTADDDPRIKKFVEDKWDEARNLHLVSQGVVNGIPPYFEFRLPSLPFLLEQFGDNYHQVAQYVNNLNPEFLDREYLCALLSLHSDMNMTALRGGIQLHRLHFWTIQMGITPIPFPEAQFVRLLNRCITTYNKDWSYAISNVFNGMTETVYSSQASGSQLISMSRLPHIDGQGQHIGATVYASFSEFHPSKQQLSFAKLMSVYDKTDTSEIQYRLPFIPIGEIQTIVKQSAAKHYHPS